MLPLERPLPSRILMTPASLCVYCHPRRGALAGKRQGLVKKTLLERESPMPHGSFQAKRPGLNLGTGVPAAWKHTMLFLKREYIIVGAVAFGAVLRCFQLQDQVLIGDEWRPINVAARFGFGEIVSRLSDTGIPSKPGDFSIPVALYYRLLLDTIGLSEVGIRTLFVVSGLLSIVILPLLIRRITGSFISNLFSWLLALSPLLILYSRFSRPYDIISFLGFFAVIVFYDWWRTGDRRYAAGYIILCGMAAYFNMVVLPFVLAPFLFCSASAFLSRNSSLRFSLIRLLPLGLLTLAFLALLFVPPLLHEYGTIAARTGDESIEPIALWKAFLILIGAVRTLPMVTCIFLLICIGSLKKYEFARSFSGYLIFLSIVQVIAVIVARPIAGKGPHVLARYLSVIIPVLMLFVSAGVAQVLAFVPKGRWGWVHTSCAGAVCLALFLEGPIPSAVFGNGRVAHIELFSRFMWGEKYERTIFEKLVKRVPYFYERLSMLKPGSVSIVEAPFHWERVHLLAYQMLHRQNVFMGSVVGLCGERDPSLVDLRGKNVHFKKFVFLEDRAELKRKGIDFAVFHKNLQGEVTYKFNYPDPDVSKCIEQYQIWYGRPVFEDRDIVVFCLRDCGSGASAR
jgi:hypothetical protein